MYAHHPPDVVTLRRLPTGIQTPETDSPLSSTPNSPRDSSAMEGSHFYEAAADLLQELMANKDDNENKQPSPIQNMSLSFQEDEIGMEDNRVPIISVPSEEEPPHLPLKKTEAPFDEAMIILTMDEKKEAEHGDELMGKQPQRTNASFSSSVHTDVDDEGQPPSLAVDRSLTEEIEEPGRINAQWNTDKLMTPSPRRTFSGDQPEDPEEEMAALRMLRTCETTPFGEEEDLLEPGPLNTTATRTPIQQLRSPPNILKQSMAWDTPTMTTGSSNPVVESPTNVVSPSPENAAPEEEDDVPIDETKATETPSVLRPMISPDGKVEGEEEEEDKSNYPMNLGHHHVTSFAKQETTTKSSSLKNEGKTPVVAPFHPQGAVSIDAPEESEGESLVTEKNASYGSAPESAVAAKQPSSVSSLNQLKSTLSDAVDLAASGAAAIVGEMVTGANKAGCGPSSHYHVVNAALESSEAEVYSHFTPPKVGSLARSVTEPMAANDWNKYLKNNDDDEMSTASDGKLNMNVTQWLNTNSKHDQSTKQPGFREMTPKRDFQSSEKTAAWLQEEFKRRYTMKYEINQAILARNDSEGGDDEVEEFIPHSDTMEDGPEIPVEKGFATALSKALEALPTSTGSSPESTKLEVSNHCEDDEVAAITTTDLSASSRSMPPRPGTIQTIHNEEEAAPKPRRLDYGSVRGVQRVPRALSTTSDYTAQTAPGRPYPMPNQFMVTPNGQYQRPTSASHTSYRNEMLRFANETRAALRDKNSEHSMPNSQFRSLAISSSAGEGDGGHSIEVAASFAEEMAKTTRLARPDSATMTEPSLGGSEAAESSDNSHFDISTTPVLVHSMDSHLGIAKGDITLSLLNENTGRLDASKKATWANRVHGAIWRCRRMRRSIGSLGSAPTLQDDRMPGTPARGRTSLPVDTDKGRVAGGVRTVQSTQEAALGHLKHDEIDEALELFEDIIFAYYAYFEKSLKAREANPGMASGGITDFRPYIGVALHNLGILNLLNGEYKEALSYFGRAVDNRKACLGEGHPDHVASLVKHATCLYALNEFAQAHAKFEQALVYARKHSRDLGDRMQMAEILNNLGCLAYMCGQPGAANAFYRESLDVQFGVLSQSLYLSSAAVGQAISLNISITRANIGFVKLVTRELSVAVTALENALMEQQLLVKGANPAIIATMDHLAVANLLNGDPQKAAMMFARILDLQQKEYGAHDRRCYVTADKINMVKSRGSTFEQAMDELRKTFSIPEPDSDYSPPIINKGERKEAKGSQVSSSMQNQQSPQKSKNQKNKVMKVFTSIRKKKTTGN